MRLVFKLTQPQVCQLFADVAFEGVTTLDGSNITHGPRHNTYYTSAEAAGHRTRQPKLRIEVQVVCYGVAGAVYRITYAGEALLEGCRCPIFEACRVLLARGISSRLELRRSGKATFDAACDVQVGAQHTIIETAEVSLRLAKWVAPSQEAISRLRH